MPGKEEGLENSSGYDSTDEEVLIYSKTNVAIVRNILDTTSTGLSHTSQSYAGYGSPPRRWR